MLCSCTENDKACDIPDTQEFTNVQINNGTTLPSLTTESTEGFYFCNQEDIGFPPIPSVQGDNQWMTDSQERLTRVYGWTCLILLILYCVVFLGQRTIRTVLSLVRGVYKVCCANSVSSFCSWAVLTSGLVFKHLFSLQTT